MKCIRLLLFIALLLGPAPVWAQMEACLVQAIPMAFGGGYDAIGSAPLYGTGQVTVTCSQPAIVRLGPGQHSAGTFFPRKMLMASGRILWITTYTWIRRTHGYGAMGRPHVYPKC